MIAFFPFTTIGRCKQRLPLDQQVDHRIGIPDVVVRIKLQVS